MILNIDNINYDFIEKQNIFIITYNNIEFCDLADKINILPIFFDIVVKNKGEIIGLKDNFEFEENIQKAVITLKEYLSNPLNQNNIFKNFLNDYIDLYGEINFNELSKYLFMLKRENIEELIKLK